MAYTKRAGEGKGIWFPATHEPPSNSGGGLEIPRRGTGLADLIFLPADFSAMISSRRLHPKSEAGKGSGRF
jgi:hypothetical protein